MAVIKNEHLPQFSSDLEPLSQANTDGDEYPRELYQSRGSCRSLPILSSFVVLGLKLLHNVSSRLRERNLPSETGVKASLRVSEAAGGFAVSEIFRRYLWEAEKKVAGKGFSLASLAQIQSRDLPPENW